MSKDELRPEEIALCEAMLKRAKIRRGIPRSERDRIADQLETAADMIMKMGKERLLWMMDAKSAQANWHAACHDISKLQKEVNRHIPREYDPEEF